jgi:hypothetical protein
MTKIGAGIVGGALGGSAASGTVLIIANKLNDEEWDKGLGQAMGTGAVIGGLSGGLGAARDIKMS